MSVTPTLYNFKKRANEAGKESVYAFLGCAKRDESPASALQGKDGLLRLIAKYTPSPRSGPRISYSILASHGDHGQLPAAAALLWRQLISYEGIEKQCYVERTRCILVITIYR